MSALQRRNELIAFSAPLRRGVQQPKVPTPPSLEQPVSAASGGRVVDEDTILGALHDYFVDCFVLDTGGYTGTLPSEDEALDALTESLGSLNGLRSVAEGHIAGFIKAFRTYRVSEASKGDVEGAARAAAQTYKRIVLAENCRSPEEEQLRRYDIKLAETAARMRSLRLLSPSLYESLLHPRRG